jgi:hypothetical protein
MKTTHDRDYCDPIPAGDILRDGDMEWEQRIEFPSLPHPPGERPVITDYHRQLCAQTPPAWHPLRPGIVGRRPEDTFMDRRYYGRPKPRPA